MTASVPSIATPICSRTGCGAWAACVPKICVPAEGWSIALHQPLSLLLQLPLCDACFAALKVEDFVGEKSDRSLRQVIALAAGRRPPDFGRAFFERVPLGSPEYRKFRAMSERKR